MGCDRHLIRALGNFHYQLIFAYVQQVSPPVEMNNSKDHISTQFMHINLYEISKSKADRLKVIHTLGYAIKHWKHLSACEDHMHIRLL